MTDTEHTLAVKICDAYNGGSYLPVDVWAIASAIRTIAIDIADERDERERRDKLTKNTMGRFEWDYMSVLNQITDRLERTAVEILNVTVHDIEKLHERERND